jgi:hypothetical protein
MPVGDCIFDVFYLLALPQAFIQPAVVKAAGVVIDAARRTE